MSIAAIFSLTSSGASQTKNSNSSFASLSARADAARDANKLDEAAALYHRALALKPRWSDGWWSLGTIQYDQDRYADAAKSFEKVIVLDPKNGTAHAMLGLCQFELKKDDAALKNLLAAEQLGILKDIQLRNVALYHLGVLQLRLGKYGAAKESFGQLSRDKIRSKELTMGMGLAALLMKAEDAPADGTPGAAVVEGVGQAEVLLTANDFDLAKRKYAELVESYPQYPNLHFAYGRLLMETHETDEAVKQFQLELQREPKHVSSMLEIAVALELVDAAGGLKYAEQATALAPNLPFAHYMLGMLRLDTGDAAGAIPELESARKAFPTEAGVYFSLGKAYAKVGRKAEATAARAEFARLNALKPKDNGPAIYGEQKRSLDPEKPLE